MLNHIKNIRIPKTDQRNFHQSEYVFVLCWYTPNHRKNIQTGIFLNLNEVHSKILSQHQDARYPYNFLLLKPKFYQKTYVLTIELDLSLKNFRYFSGQGYEDASTSLGS